MIFSVTVKFYNILRASFVVETINVLSHDCQFSPLWLQSSLQFSQSLQCVQYMGMNHCNQAVSIALCLVSWVGVFAAH